MNIHNICKGVHYVGINDRTTQLFEGLWPLPMGVSYNSYIIEGEKIALIDTVHISQCIKFLSKVTDIIGTKKIDYLVINHMEPDHSGSIQIIKEKFPDIKIIGNTKTAGMIKGFYNITDNVISVSDGEVLDLGNETVLRFVHTPMVHWPETMMTYLEKEGVLFSGDAFGCYGALNGGIIDREMEICSYIPEMYRYYSNIVAKYGIFVQKAIAKLSNTKLNYICSTHGPVWSEKINDVVSLYDKLSKSESDKGVVVAYGSMYGNTEELAEAIAARLCERGITDIKIYNLSTTNISYVLSDIVRFKGLVIGGPTYSNGLFPPVENLLSAIKTREIKDKSLAFFGSYTWAPTVSKKIKEYIDCMKLNIVSDSFDMKQAPTQNEYDACKNLADKIADNI